MIDVSEIIQDPDFAQTYSVQRDSGKLVNGRWVPNTTNFDITGVVTVANSQDVQQLPEGDRVVGIMAFHSTQLLQITNPEGISDIITWRGEQYKLLQVYPYGDYGYYKALGARIQGQ